MAPLPLRVMLAALELVHQVPTALIPAIVGDQSGAREIINVHDPLESTTPLIHDTTSLFPIATFISSAAPSPTDTVVVTFESLERRAEPDEEDDDTSSTPTTKHSSSTRTRTHPTTTVTVTRSVFTYLTSKTSSPGKLLSSSTHSGSDDILTASTSSPVPTPLVATLSSISSISTVRNLFQDANWSPPEAQSLRDTRARATIGASVGVIVLVLLGLVWGMRVRAARRRMIKYGVALPSGAEKPANWNGKLRNVWRIRRMKKAEDQRLKDEMSTRYGGNGAASSGTLTTLTALNGF